MCVKMNPLHYKDNISVLCENLFLLLLLCTYNVQNVSCESLGGTGSGGGYYIKLLDFKNICPLHSFCVPWNFMYKASMYKYHLMYLFLKP